MRIVNKQIHQEDEMKLRQESFRKSWMIWILVGLILALSSGVTFAQDVATGAATGTVVPLIVVTAVAPLDFGTLWQGVPKSIPSSGAGADSAAIFDIVGQPGGVNLQLILPEYIVLANGHDRMPISFTATDAAIETLTTTTPEAFLVATDGWVDQNPYVLPAASRIGAAGNIHVYLGGRAWPSTNQAAGVYGAEIVLMAAYNNQ